MRGVSYLVSSITYGVSAIFYGKVTFLGVFSSLLLLLILFDETEVDWFDKLAGYISSFSCFLGNSSFRRGFLTAVSSILGSGLDRATRF